MKILVCVKRAVDYNVRIQIKSDGSGVVTDGVKHDMNPFDQIAMEEAMRLKEAGVASEIIPLSIGGAKSQETLRTALAFGADRAIHVSTDLDTQPLLVAKIIAKIAAKEDAGIILMGKQAIDDDCNQTGQMTATLMGRPQATFASKIEIADNKAQVTREVDAGLETLEVDLPAVITTDLRLNEPRYLKLPDVMKAKRKPLEEIAFDSLDITPPPSLETIATTAPKPRSKGIMVNSVDELVAELKTRSLV